MIYIIAYDVADNGRRSRVAKCLEGWGRRVQKSVFECDLSHDELDTVRGRLEELLNPEKDRCHLYRICAECRSFGVVTGAELEPPVGQTVVV